MKIVLMLVAVGLMAAGASGEILENGDFEADAGSIVAANAPTSWEWEFATYSGGIPNSTIDVSAIGGGGGGTVGILLGNWDTDAAWSDGIQGYFDPIGVGTYTVSITYAVTDSGIDSGMWAGLYDVVDNSDPATVWNGSNYSTAAAAIDGPALQTTVDTWHTMDIVLTTTSSSNTLFINSAGYNPGQIIIGAVSMVPEPATLGLLSLGALSLIRRRKRK